MEQPQGLHGRERCSFLRVVQAEGERKLEIWICYEVGKPESYLANCRVFIIGLGPVLVDSYP
jgi:hypothetical protein